MARISRLKLPEKARQQHALKGVPVDRAGAGAELFLLREQAVPDAGLLFGLLVPVRQAACSIEKRQDPPQIAIADRVERTRVSRDLVIGGQRLLHVGELLFGGGVSAPQQKAAGREYERDASKGAATQQQPPASDAWALGDQHRFAEDHLLHEAGQEIAATLFGTKAWRAALINAEGAREEAGQAIDRRAFLNARRQVKAAQHRRGVEAGADERFVHELGDWLFEARKLARKAGDQRPPLGAAFGLEAVEEALVQALPKRLEFLPQPPDGPRITVGEGESRAPHLGAALSVEIVEELAEPSDQIGLRQQHVDRQSDRELSSSSLMRRRTARACAIRSSRAAVTISETAIATITPFRGWRSRARFRRLRKASQPARSTAASKSRVV